MKIKNLIGFPVLFMSITHFAQAQSLNFNKSTDKIDSTISEIKKLKFDKDKAEGVLASAIAGLRSACSQVAEEIKFHNNKIGELGSACSVADIELKSRQSLLEEAIQKHIEFKSNIEGIKNSKKELNKEKVKDLNDSNIDTKILALRTNKKNLEEDLKKHAEYNINRNLVGGELKKKKEERKGIFDACLEYEHYSESAFNSCSKNPRMVAIDSGIVSLENTIFNLNVRLSTLNEIESVLIALKASPIKDRGQILKKQMNTLEDKQKGLEKGLFQQEKTVAFQKLDVLKAINNFGNVNKPKGICRSTGVLAMPAECSF